MVDIHSHILYGMDDGASSSEQSLAMLDLAITDGVSDIVATPHANPHFAFRPDRIEEQIAELAAARRDRIRIHRGCDFHLSFDNIEDAFAHPDKYTINHKCYLLVEFSDLLIPKSTDDLFGRMRQVGLTPIITHPERNPLLRKRIDNLEEWTAAGCLIQVTAQSLLGRFGKRAEAAAMELLSRNLVHFIASDAHDTVHRPPLLRAAFEFVSRKFGTARAELLFSGNPASVLTGDPLPFVDQTPQEQPAGRKWWKW
jgi:protein-tyrosine phosphatase